MKNKSLVLILAACALMGGVGMMDSNAAPTAKDPSVMKVDLSEYCHSLEHMITPIQFTAIDVTFDVVNMELVDMSSVTMGSAVEVPFIGFAKGGALLAGSGGYVDRWRSTGRSYATNTGYKNDHRPCMIRLL